MRFLDVKLDALLSFLNGFGIAVPVFIGSEMKPSVGLYSTSHVETRIYLCVNMHNQFICLKCAFTMCNTNQKLDNICSKIFLLR